MRLFFEKYKILLSIFIIFIFVLLAYSQTFKMYFWQDDYTHLYFAQQHVVPSFPYQMNTYLVALLYRVFGLVPVYYFIVEVCLFFLAALAIFATSKLILKQSLYSLLVSLVFVSGYVGQQTIWMMSDGLSTLAGLVVFLLTIYFFLKFHLKQSRQLLYAIFLLSFVTYELTPHRFMGLVVILILGDIIFASRVKLKHTVLRIAGHCGVFIIQYWLHPTRFIYPYTLPTEPSSSLSLLKFFDIRYLLNYLNGCCAVLLPTDFLETLYKVIGKFLPVTYLVQALKIEPVVLMGSVVGTVVLIIGLYFVFKGSLDRKIGLVIFSLPFLMLTPFLLIKSEFVLVSSHRYLMASSFVSSFWLCLTISSKRKIKDNYLFILLCLVLIISRLIYGWRNQNVFVSTYSNHARRYFNQLIKILPAVSTKKLIYAEATTKELWYSLGDASRVGQLPTQAAYAVHYNTPLDNFILPESMGDIPQLMKQYNLRDDDIVILFYDGQTLENVTKEYLDVKKEINNSPRGLTLVEKDSDNNYSLLTNFSTYFPANINVYLQTKGQGKGQVKIVREYSPLGSLYIERLSQFEITCGKVEKLTLPIESTAKTLNRLRVITEGCPIVKVSGNYYYEAF